MRSYILPLFCLALSFNALAQNPIKWTFTTKDAGNCQVDLILTGILEEGWCTYSQFLDSEDGPVATTLNFTEAPNFKLIGKATEGGEIIQTHDVVFNMKLTKFKHKAVLTQRVEVLDPSKPISGYVNYMTCNDEMCLPPKDAAFSFKIPALNGCKTK